MSVIDWSSYPEPWRTIGLEFAAEVRENCPQWGIPASHRFSEDMRAAPVPLMRRIQELVCGEFGISIAQIISARRNHETTRPRQIAMYLCRIKGKRSFAEIGRTFNRDHSTVINACEAIGKRLECGDAQLIQLIARLGEFLGADAT